MKLKPYPEYNDSGIQWIGEIPEGWNNYKLKHVVNEFVAGGTPRSDDEKFWAHDEHGIPWVNIGDMTNKEIVTETKKEITVEGQADKGLRILKKGTLLYSIFASLGKVAVLGIDATTNQAILGLIISKKIYTIFLKYYLKNLEEPIITLSNANTQNNLNSTIVKNIEIAIPSLSDQTTIASFLDKKNAKIDALIEKDKKLIVLLKEKRTALINHAVTKGLDPNVKLKDSWIEWIGEIPEDAKIMPFRRVCYVNQGLQFPEDERLSEPDEKSKIYITIKYIHADEDGVKEYIPNPPRSVICKKEDVLLARTGATGEVITNQEGVFHNNFFKVNYISKIDRDYLVYYLKMDSIKKVLLLKAGVTTIPDLNHDAFLSTPFILYSIEKQKQIAGYLDKKTAKIDKTIKLIEKKIKLLEEYKKSLIHHVVTGKVDVRKSEV